MNTIAAQLRGAKHRASAGAISADEKRRAKRAMLSAIGADLAVVESVSLRAQYLLWISRACISRPVAIGAAGVVLMTSGLLTTVNAAQNSLPGDVLYTVKRINERAQLELASLDRRAVLHTEFAERRLREFEQLQANEVTRNSSVVTETVNAYAQEVALANQNLRALQASGDVSTSTVANEIDQNLSTLGSSMQNTETPVTSEEGSAALSAAVTTMQAAQEDTIAVAVEAHNQDATESSTHDVQEMLDRQFVALLSRQAFDLRRLHTLRAFLQEHAEDFDGGVTATERDCDRLERSITIALADVAPTMDVENEGGYRSAFDALRRADNLLRGIESSIAEVEIEVMEKTNQLQESDQGS